MVNEDRRNVLKIFIGSSVALSLGALTAPLVGSVINAKALALKGEYSSVEVVLCENVDNCPEEYSVPISELRQGPKFVLLKKGNMAIPAVFGLVKATDGKEYPVAYNTVCTHFGCPVNPTGGKYLMGFACPCHGSFFNICPDPNGCVENPDECAKNPDKCKRWPFLEAYVSGGPAPRSLRPIKVAVKGDRVYAVKAYI
ncbi:MAG: Rieske 2Fe-2S domain-containing protein [Pyrobaculum sp.]|jgi:ubiquinol-cytochrome c reductase iron-sulfur subunit/cytochrome b6-f complex iron-sulfur subunit|nr:Rieske 2Fe-2S domain-containing protein [Pyrobaculum sp.]